MRLCSIVVFALVACCATPQPEPPRPPTPAVPNLEAPKPVPRAPKAPVALEEYFKVRRVGGASFSFDEKQVAYVSDEGGRLDIWVQPVDGGPARQLTHVKGFVHSFAFSPTSDRLMYESDEGGNELPHLYLTNAAGKEAEDVTADYPAGARTAFIDWAEDGKTFLYLSNLRDRKYMDLLEFNLATRKSTTLWESSDKLSFVRTSRNHKRFIIEETLSDANNNLYLFDRGRKDLALLTKHDGDALFWSRDFTKDLKTLYYTTDKDREFQGLCTLDLTTKASKSVLQPQWDVDNAGFSRGWSYFFTVTNNDGTLEVALTDAKHGTPVALPKLDGEGALVPFNFSKSDRYVAATLLTDVSPVALYVLDLKENNTHKLTEVLPESLRAHKMVGGQSVRIVSFDQRQVPAYVYRPAGNGPFPAVIDVHGGPTFQSQRWFDPLRQYLVSKGYVVLVPNVRGSTGYGKSYTRLDNLDLGGGPLKDVVAAKAWLAKEAQVDPAKVVVLGGSYGGYMALAAATFTPGEFAASVDYFGVADLKTLVESFPPYWAAGASYIHQKFGDPKNPAHAAYQHDRSPINYVQNIVCPLLVVQGSNDARVKQDQSDRIVSELKKREVPVHYLVFPDEGHGFSRNENRLRAYQLTDRFLDHYLIGDTSMAVEPK